MRQSGKAEALHRLLYLCGTTIAIVTLANNARQNLAGSPLARSHDTAFDTRYVDGQIGWNSPLRKSVLTQHACCLLGLIDLRS
jgi:hypothetical protein